jgi:hypothetical protein
MNNLNLILIPLVLTLSACASFCAQQEASLKEHVSTNPIPPTINNIQPPSSPEVNSKEVIHLTPQQADLIGHKIWMNEGAAKVENLTVWNQGETFASLGIGHFIWYPAGQDGPYQEGFPPLLKFLQQQKVTLPAWLQNFPNCPWNTRQDFYKAINGVQMQSLRNLLKDTIPLQVQFIIQRLEQALPKMLAALASDAERQQVREQFYRVAQIPNGVYALIDYVNFKGEGIAVQERYNGEGWGLLQVLQAMSSEANEVMVEFVRAADLVLTRRVANSPKGRNESQWLEGWRHRLKTYVYQLK